ncbi:MAG: hypothetical protein AB7J40_00840 [Candidatus Altimarinota bacterium]
MSQPGHGLGLRYRFEHDDIPVAVDGKLQTPPTEAEKAAVLQQLVEGLNGALAPFTAISSGIESVRNQINPVLGAEFSSVVDLVGNINKARQERGEIDSPVASESTDAVKQRLEGKKLLKDALQANLGDIELGKGLRTAITNAVAQIKEETSYNAAVRHEIGDDNDPSAMFLDANMKAEEAIRAALEAALADIQSGSEGSTIDLITGREAELQTQLVSLAREIADLEKMYRDQSDLDGRKKVAAEKLERLQKLLMQLQEPLNGLKNLTGSIEEVRQHVGQIGVELQILQQPSQILTLPENVLEELAAELNRTYDELCDLLIGFYRTSAQKLYKAFYAAETRDHRAAEASMDASNAALLKLLPDALKADLFPLEAELQKLKGKRITAGTLKHGEQKAIDAFFQRHASGTPFDGLSFPEIVQLLKREKFAELSANITQKPAATGLLMIKLRQIESGKSELEQQLEARLQKAAARFKSFMLSKVGPATLQQDLPGKIRGKDETAPLRTQYRSLENQLVETALLPLMKTLVPSAEAEVLEKLQAGHGTRSLRVTLGDQIFVLSSTARKEGEGFARDYQINTKHPSQAGDPSLISAMGSLIDHLRRGDAAAIVQVAEITS